MWAGFLFYDISLKENNMLDYIIKQTNLYIKDMPKIERKKYGQFFTSKETAIFMARLYDIPNGMNKLTILDAGAGSGILSAALIEQLQNSSINIVELTCYENDKKILELLKSNLQYIQDNVKFKFYYRIITENYITSQYLNLEGNLAYDNILNRYDLVIGNPPYKKIPKEASEALALPNVCYGAPNIYFLFATMGLLNLKDNGEMVYIIPRSWTSGAYFKKFREYFLNNCTIEHIHLFVSRSKVFRSENVLQETMVIKIKKCINHAGNITITSSNNNNFDDVKVIYVPYNVAVSEKEHYVYLITDEKELLLLEQFKCLKETLPSIGLKMRTGLTVDFRNKELLYDTPGKNTIPLFYSQHIKNGRIEFPINKKAEYISIKKTGLVQPNSNYLFIKRFTSKEESRRLQCGIYLSQEFPFYELISTQNKINFIDNVTHNLSENIVYGLYVLFNSTAYDMYYRILNGSTQVNSTEINTMPVPSLSEIEELGQVLIKSNDLTEENCDKILGSFFDDQNRRSEKVS